MPGKKTMGPIGTLVFEIGLVTIVVIHIITTKLLTPDSHHKEQCCRRRGRCEFVEN